jgi:hypothetical protein
MQDYAAFCRQRAEACFHRRRKYPLGSEDREQAVKDTRDFIRYCRADWQSRPAHERLAAAAEITRTVYALGPNVRLQRRLMRNEP